MEKVKYKIKECELANREHKESKRQYAHVFHNINTICIAHAMRNLPATHYYGILAHEIGHLISGGGERQADRIMYETYGIKIRYKDSKYGNRLEYLTKKDIEKLNEYFKFE